MIDYQIALSSYTLVTFICESCYFNNSNAFINGGAVYLSEYGTQEG